MPAPAAEPDSGPLKYFIAAAVLGACVGNMFVARKMRSISKMKVPTGESVTGRTAGTGAGSAHERVNVNRARRMEEEAARAAQRFKDYQYQKDQQEQVRDAYQAWARGHSPRPKAGPGFGPLSAMGPSLRKLGLPPDQLPSRKEVKDAFAKVAMETHPDKKEGSAARFGEVSDAHKLLLKQLDALEGP